MDKSQADKQAFQATIADAVAKLDAIGPMPLGERGRLVRYIHPDAEAWEQQVADVGRSFLLAAWEIAKAGNNFAIGYVLGFIYPATDEIVAAYAATKINARWAEAIRAMV